MTRSSGWFLAGVAAACAWVVLHGDEPSTQGPITSASRTSEDEREPSASVVVPSPPVLRGLPPTTTPPRPTAPTEEPPAEPTPETVPPPAVVTREYALPRPPKGDEWVSALAPDEIRDDNPCPLREVTAEEISRQLTTIARMWGDLSGVGGRSRAWSKDQTLFVHASETAHARIAAYLGSLTWVSRWAGLRPAAAELADMWVNGSPAERDWAERAMAAVSQEMREAVEAAQTCAGGPAGSWATDLSRLAAPGRAKIQVRRYAADTNLLRDLGIDIGGEEVSLWSSLGARSASAFLDDTQSEVLARCAGRHPERLSEVAHTEIVLTGGEERTVSIDPEGLLRLRTLASQDGRYVHLDLRMRFWVGGSLVFAPRLVSSVPDGGSILVRPADGVERDATSGLSGFLIVAVEVEAPSRAAATSEEPSED